MQKIGRYTIREKVGQGAMGVVYLAEDDLISRQVAIKTLRSDRFKEDDEYRAALDLFMQEARIIGQLNHSHITTIYDMGVHDGAPYIVMEFIDGCTIKDLISRKAATSLEDKLGLLVMLARAFHYAHQHGVLHRDIKPANIMILKDWLPKITDFGIARIMQAAGNNLMRDDGEVLGTPLYMSPEQIRGKVLDQRSDVFSMGVLAYEWLVYQKPFHGATQKDRFKSVLMHSPDLLSTIHHEIDDELAGIIARALAKKREGRFQSAEEFADSLELYLDRRFAHSKKKNPSQRFSFDALKIIAQLKEKYLFFNDFSEEELGTIFKLSTKESYETYDYLIRKGTSGTTMYIILAGGVAVVDDSEDRYVVLDELGEGSCVGEMAIVDRLPRSASVIATTETRALAINETVLRLSNPALCLKLYRNLASIISERLRASEDRYTKILDRMR
ncbi:MAG: serine/threonine-protein kinase [Desulfobulbaceae bacterium]|nr:serine/threonine-protein kinase [Desulfobulbaceae bacterium]